MTAATLLTSWLIQLVGQLPELVVGLGLCVWVLVQWQRVRAGAVWALFGFGLLWVLALLSPGAQVAAQYLALEDGLPAKSIGAILTVYALGRSALHALADIFLAVAIYKGRPSSIPPLPTILSPPPLPRRQDLPPA